jgi:hypothetical protein
MLEFGETRSRKGKQGIRGKGAMIGYVQIHSLGGWRLLRLAL